MQEYHWIGKCISIDHSSDDIRYENLCRCLMVYGITWYNMVCMSIVPGYSCQLVFFLNTDFIVNFCKFMTNAASYFDYIPFYHLHTPYLPISSFSTYMYSSLSCSLFPPSPLSPYIFLSAILHIQQQYGSTGILLQCLHQHSQTSRSIMDVPS